MANMASHMDTHMPKHNISSRSVDKTLLAIFDDLFEKSETKRNESCVKLVQYLAEGVAVDGEDELSPNLKYCLRRLVRGLGGSLQKNQQINFTALVAVLHSFPSITLDIFLGIVDSECGTQCASSGTGIKSPWHILTIGTVIRSGLFEKASEDQKLNMTKSLVSYGQKNSPNVALPFLLDLIQKSSDDLFIMGVWPVLEEIVSKPWSEQTLDSLMLLMAVMASHSNVVQNKHLRKFLSAKSTPFIAEKLLVAKNLEHPFYEEFCNILCVADHKPLLERFWTVEVAKQLATSSRPKEIAALHILALLLQKISDKKIAYLLATAPVLQLISHILQEHQRSSDLHSKAHKTLCNLVEALVSADVSDHERLELLKKFFLVSKNQTVMHQVIPLESKLSKDGVKILAEQFCNVVLGIPLCDEQQLTMKDRKFAAQQLARLTCLKVCDCDIEWKVKQLSFLAEYGMFEGHSSNINAELAGTLKQCFFHALDQKFSSLVIISQILMGTVRNLNELLFGQRGSSLTLRSQFDDETSSAWKKMFKIVMKLDKEQVSRGKDNPLVQIFFTLFLFMGLELFADASMARESLFELQACYSHHKKGEKAPEDSEEPAWMDVTVELLLSFLAHDSHVNRSVVCAVFRHLSKHLTATSFSQILKVLDPAQGENPFSTSQELDDSSDDDSELLDNKANDAKENGTNGHKEDEEETTDSSEEDSTSDSEEEENGPDEEQEQLMDILRQELHKALGDSAALTDTESVDVDDIDDEEGERINAALCQAFKSFCPRKPRSRQKIKENVKKEEAFICFRTRVLDLVEMYISHDPSMSLCLESLSPLLNLYSFCTKNKLRKSLESRVRSVLIKLTGLKKFSSLEFVDDTILADKIKSLIAQGIKTNSFLSQADLVVECCTFAVRCSIVLNAQNQKPLKSQQSSPVVSIYKSMLSEYFSKRDTLLPISLFKAVCQLNWEGCWALLNLALESALNTNIRLFCRRQALVLLTVIFRNKILLASGDSIRKQALLSVASRLTDHTVELLNSSVQSKVSRQFLPELLHCLAEILSSPETESIDKSTLSSAITGTVCGVNNDIRKALKKFSKRCNFSKSSMKASKKQKKNKLNSTSLNQETDNGPKQFDIKTKEEAKETIKATFNGLLPSMHVVDSIMDGKTNTSESQLKRHKKKKHSSKMGDDSESVILFNTNGYVNGSASDDKFQNGTLKSLNGKAELKRKSKLNFHDSESDKRKRKKQH